MSTTFAFTRNSFISFSFTYRFPAADHVNLKLTPRGKCPGSAISFLDANLPASSAFPSTQYRAASQSRKQHRPDPEPFQPRSCLSTQQPNLGNPGNRTHGPASQSVQGRYTVPAAR